MKNYRRLLETPQGGRLAYEHVELAERLMDDAWLDSFAPGTVGAAYREFVRSENISAEGLAEISRARQSKVEQAHPHAWFGRRTRDSHDIWHILSGYHRDGLGEACLVAFSYAQTGSLGWAVIALGAALRQRRGAKHPYRQAIWQGYRRGKAAAWLAGEDYEQLMHEPLDAARRRLNITPATLYNAIPAADRDGALPPG
jgi:ubiquinone biosynthesis protein COQ4